MINDSQVLPSPRELPRSNLPTKGVVLLNLGSPDEPSPEAVGKYLKQFLMDRWVIDIPYLWRWILVHWLIVPKRKHLSAEAYKTIWTQEGAPLRVHLDQLAKKVKALLGPDYVVVQAMRYGQPSIEEAVRSLNHLNLDKIVTFPLYPQYAESSTRSSVEEVQYWLRELKNKSQLEFVSSFYADKGFIDSFVENIRPVWKNKNPDHLLLSFHGLPERHLKKTDTAPGDGRCLIQDNCCHQISEFNQNCYRAQCFATAREITQSLGLASDQVTVSFQSRLGKDPWIRPYSDEMVVELANRGIRRLVVACPAFVADCLETTEEMGDRAKELFLRHGGQEYFLVPCPNSSDTWAKAVTSMIASRL